MKPHYTPKRPPAQSWIRGQGADPARSARSLGATHTEVEQVRWSKRCGPPSPTSAAGAPRAAPGAVHSGRNRLYALVIMTFLGASVDQRWPVGTASRFDTLTGVY